MLEFLQQSSCAMDENNTTIMNSALYGNVTVGDKSVVSCCKIRGNVTIGKDCYVAGLNVENFKVKGERLKDKGQCKLR